jgi:hypothetical protein
MRALLDLDGGTYRVMGQEPPLRVSKILPLKMKADFVSENVW